jgi:signal transduction histidine kinase
VKNWRTPSLAKRVVLGGMMIPVAFALLTAINLYYEYYKGNQGDVDVDLLSTSNAIAASLHAAGTSRGEWASDVRLLDNMMNHYMRSVKQSMHEGLQVKRVVRLLDRDGTEIYRTAEHAAVVVPQLPSGSSRFTHQGETWHVGTTPGAPGDMQVQVMEAQSSIAGQLNVLVWRFIVLPVVVFVPIASLITWLVSVYSMRPLKRFAQAIAEREPGDLRPIQGLTPYSETKPIVDELNSLLAKLEGTLLRERSFVADAAHELRTPLAVVQAQLHLLRQAPDGPARTAAYNDLSAGVERATSMVRNLLLSARLSAEHVAPKTAAVDLSAMLQERIAAISPLATLKGVELELDSPRSCEVQLDREMFSSAIDNVLDNAVRYSQAGGKVLVELQAQPGGTLRVRVADEGQGIPPELRARVFERFFRVAGTEEPGTGLGLAIVKRVLGLHGGAVQLSDGLAGRGLAVEMQMPMRA